MILVDDEVNHLGMRWVGILRGHPTRNALDVIPGCSAGGSRNVFGWYSGTVYAFGHCLLSHQGATRGLVGFWDASGQLSLSCTPSQDPEGDARI